MIDVFVPLVVLVLIVTAGLLVYVQQQISWGSGHLMLRFAEDAWLYTVPGARKPINFFWASFTLLGSLGVLVISASSYYGRNFFSFNSSEFLVPFLPQGVTLTFYGISGLFVSFHWWLLILWNVGSGYNLYDKKKGMVRFFRYGFPGENRRILSKVRVEDILALQFFDNPEPLSGVLYMHTREQGDIPLTLVDDYYDRTPRNILQTAWDLSAFLDVPLEIIV